MGPVTTCEHFCGVGRRALANSGLPAAAQARLKADFGHIKPKNPPLPCCGSKKSKKPSAKKAPKKKTSKK